MSEAATSDTTYPIEESKYGIHDDNCYGRCTDHRDWFVWGTRGLLNPDEAHEILDMVLNRLAEPPLDESER